MKRFPVIILLISFLHTHAQLPEVFLFDAARIGTIKNKLQRADAASLQLVKYVINEADKMLVLRPFSVMDKSFTPPSGDKHDYMSLAPYFWPDSTKPDGLPYIRRDGQRNPMIDKITDKKGLVDIGRISQMLALAYVFSGDEKYAKKATDYLRTWFVDPATKMNPNLTYAQAVLGVNDGRGIGIIETVALTNVVDAIGMLKTSAALPEKDRQTISNWFDQYLHWMLTSKNGTDERHALNNHGIWYDMQVISFSLFLHKNEFARQYLDSTLKRIPVQFEPDGRQPLELERTTALGYSTFSLDAWFKTAIMASKFGVDIWHYQAKDGRSIQKALDWLIPYSLGEKKWEYQQIKEYSEINNMYFLLLEAVKHYPAEPYKDALKKIKVHGVEITELLYGNE